MNLPHIKVFPNPEAMAAKALEWLRKKSDDPSASIVTVAISGGTTPFAMFRELTKLDLSGVNWKKIHLFWVDERCVPPDHHESNYKNTVDSLLSKIPAFPENIHRIFGENDPESETHRYASLIKDLVPVENQFPMFDLVLLGVGEDGHTASIFPGREDLLRSERWCAQATHPQTGQRRITLTGNVLNNAKTVAFLITGESKAPIVKSIVEHAPKFPASHIRSTSGNTYFLLDSESFSSCPRMDAPTATQNAQGLFK